MANSAFYHNDPQRSQPDLQQHYDAPYGRGGTGFIQDIPMVAPKYGHRDSQVNMGGRVYSSAESSPPKDAWRESSATRNNTSSRSNLKWMLIGGIALFGFLGAGTAVALVLSKKNAPASSSSVSPGSSTLSNSDPSSFAKDPALAQSFYGIAYTPEGSQMPNCGNSLNDVITDIQLLSQLTTRIRLYGADCNQTELVLEAIKQTDVNMTVWLGNYAVATDDGAAYTRQRDAIKTAIQKYGMEHIGGLTVGNEFILNYLEANNATDPNGPVGNAGAAILIANIEDTRSMMRDLSLTNVAIGTSDAGSFFNTKILAAVDYGMANVHPWFADTTIQDAAGWTAEFFSDTDLKAAAAVSNAPQMYIAETGWPTGASNSVASEANLQIFLDTFVCQANKNGTKYFFFEYFDEKWKDELFGGVEGHWGLFYHNRTLKGITIPTCG
ncbi:glycoside hydrolase [Mycena albidolilacea]|uniref:glucan endo-1,3-beta-D-glucosidase n=1 Tax=Mycena albidolilacea TaxID=1033008 RepID=A0AAD7ANU2_9AGAR|nr:glycoside hydrolase [Mycena albidolilacea]